MEAPIGPPQFSVFWLMALGRHHSCRLWARAAPLVHRWWRCGVSCFAGLTAILLVPGHIWELYEDQRDPLRQDRFARVTPGMTEKQVADLLGRYGNSFTDSAIYDSRRYGKDYPRDSTDLPVGQVYAIWKGDRGKIWVLLDEEKRTVISTKITWFPPDDPWADLRALLLRPWRSAE